MTLGKTKGALQNAPLVFASKREGLPAPPHPARCATFPHRGKAVGRLRRPALAGLTYDLPEAKASVQLHYFFSKAEKTTLPAVGRCRAQACGLFADSNAFPRRGIAPAGAQGELAVRPRESPLGDFGLGPQAFLTKKKGAFCNAPLACLGYSK